MLPSGADVKIGAMEFMLDRADDSTGTSISRIKSYHHEFQSLYPQTQRIAGGGNRSTANSSMLLWRQNDWSGGNGTKFYDTSLASSYYNDTDTDGRVPGILQARPPKYTDSGSPTATVDAAKVTMAWSAGYIWLLAGRQIYYSSDGAAWTAHTSNPQGAAGSEISAAVGLRDELWFSMDNAAATARITYRIAGITATTTAVTSVTGPRFLGMAELGGFVYGWTGRNLLRYNPQVTLPITQAAKHKVYKPYNDNPTGNYHGDMASSENAVYVMVAYKGDSTIHEFRHHKGFPIWQLPQGLSARAICYNLGTLYCIGHYGNRFSLFGMDVSSRAWYHLADFKPNLLATETITAVSVAAGYGSQVIGQLTSATTNYNFVYDAEKNAISELSNNLISSLGNAGSCGTYHNRRVFAYFKASTGVLKTEAFAQDYDVPDTLNATLESSAYDFDFPQDSKTLLGFDVSQSPSGSDYADIYYQKDEDGSWVLAGSTQAGDAHRYITISTSSSTISFRQLRYRIVLHSGCQVYAVTARAYVNAYQEVWGLRLKLDDEKSSDAPSSRNYKGWRLRDYLLGLVASKTVVAFLDGMRYPKKGGLGDGYAASVDVVLEFPIDSITNNNAEGSMELVLRAVQP